MVTREVDSAVWMRAITGGIVSNPGEWERKIQATITVRKRDPIPDSFWRRHLARVAAGRREAARR